MANIVADELSQIPMSPNLVATLARAADHASSRNNREVTLEHLLAALLEDQDAGQILGSSSMDLPRLASSVAAHLDGAPGTASGERPGDLKLSAELARILTAAAAAAQQGRRPEISGAIVLAAIVGDGESAAARLLRGQGLTFDAAIRALQRAATAAMAAPSQTAPPRTPPEPPAPVLEGQPSGGGHSEPRARPPAPPPPAAPASVEEAPRAPSLAAGEPPQRPAPPEPVPVPAPRNLETVREAPAADAPQSPAPEITAASLGLGELARDRRETTGGRRARAPAAPPAGAPRPEFAYRPRDQSEESVSPPGERQAPSLAPERPRAPMDRGSAPWRVEATQLAWSIPRTMRTHTPAIVEAHIAKAKVKIVFEGSPEGRHEFKAAKAVAARLRAPGDAFWIELGAPETQWIEDSQGAVVDDIAVWRWTVTPKKRGRTRFQLLSSVRVVDASGLVAQAALPDQAAEIRVRANFAPSVRRAFIWFAAALAGWLFAMFGAPLWEAARQAIAPFLGA